MNTNASTLADQLILKKNPNPFPFLRGVNFGYLAKAGYYGTKQAELEVDRMAEAGVEWVSLMVMLMQETFYSTRVCFLLVFLILRDVFSTNYFSSL